jgi:MFS transporter, DHA1 family, multidrug resistance protein
MSETLAGGYRRSGSMAASLHSRVGPGLLFSSLVLASVLGIGASNILIPSIPAMGRSLGAPVDLVQLSFAAYLAAYAAGLLVLGPLSDRCGRRRIILLGAALCAAGSLAGAISPSVGWLIAARMAQGIGACAGTVVARAVLADLYDRERTAQALATLGFAVTFVQTLAPILGGQIESGFGWRWSFAAVALWSLFAFALARGVLPGAIASSGSPTRAARIGAAYRELIGTRRFIAYALVAAGAHAGSHAFAAGVPALLIDRFGVSAAWLGFYAALPPIGFVAGCVLARRLVERLGIERLIALGILLLVQAGLVMVLLRCECAAAIVGPAVAISIASGIITPNAITASLTAADASLRGLAAGLITFLQIAAGMGATLALALIGSSGPRTLALVIAGGGLLAASAYCGMRKDPDGPAAIAARPTAARSSR